jgi:hypothetical protein
MAVDIIQGGKQLIVVRLVDKNTGDPYDLTGATAITTCFHNADGTELMLGLGTGVTVLAPTFGKIQIALTAVQTALLTVAQLQTLEIAITFVSGIIKVQIPEAYNVVQTVC